MFRHQNKKKSTNRIQNTFETAFEKTIDYGKGTTKEVVDALNPFSQLFENPTKSSPEGKRGNHTDVDFEKLQDAYASQDEEAIRQQQELLYPEQTQEQRDKQNRMEAHQRVLREEREFNAQQDQEDAEEEKMEAQREHEENEKKQEERIKMQQQDEPKGKVKKNIFGKGKQIAQTNLPPEMKPGRGSS